MNWITIIWSMVASACLTLAAINLLVWSRKRTDWEHLLFSLTAVGTAAMAVCELWMMGAETPEQFGTALRWYHVPAWVVIVSMIGFVQLHLRAGRTWLAWTIYALRTFSLLLNFLVGQNLNYREITHLRHIPFLGKTVSLAEGVSNSWMLVGQLSLLLFVVFVTDVAITVWRRGDRRQALVTGGGIVFFVLAITVQAVLVLWEIVSWPLTASFFYTAIVAAVLRLDFFYLEYGDFHGSLLAAKVALEYNLWKYVGVGLAYDVFRLQVKGEGKDYPGIDLVGKQDISYGGLLLYGKFYF